MTARKLPPSWHRILAAGLLCACHDAGPAAGRLAPSPSGVVAFLVVEETPVSTRFVLRAKVRVGGSLNLPAAFNVKVTIPAGTNVSASDIATDPSVLRVMNVVNGELRVAGASAAGVDELFAVRIEAPSREALSDARLVVDELVDRLGNDLRPFLRTASRPSMVKPK